MRTSLICALFLLLTLNLQAQDPNRRTLNINESGAVTVPADIIIFNIEINAEAKTPQEAYELHKEREQRLVELLKEHGIAEEDIRYQPISIHRNRVDTRMNGGSETVAQTRQSVTLTMRDFDIFETIQVELIEADFDQFNTHFAASETEKAKDDALQEAITNARQKAELIAEETGGAVGQVVEVTYGTPSIQRGFEMAMRADASSGSMMQFEQSVTVTVSVAVQFQLESR